MAEVTEGDSRHYSSAAHFLVGCLNIVGCLNVQLHMSRLKVYNCFISTQGAVQAQNKSRGYSNVSSSDVRNNRIKQT
jgi:hypothetical protein